MKTLDNKKVRLSYTDWFNETKNYIITPKIMYWGSTNYYPDVQWLMIAVNEETQEEEVFTLRSIHSWIENGKN